MSNDTSNIKVQTILCIPGPWNNQKELVEAVVTKTDGKFLLAGQFMLRMGTQEMFRVECCRHDPRMLNSFKTGGPHWQHTPEMARIAEHKMVVYIVGEGGSPEKAEALMHPAEALLNAGGFGVKVESSGLAHNLKTWRKHREKVYLVHIGLHEAYVLYLTGQQVYSCGMHNLGYKDAVVQSNQVEGDPLELIRVFTRYIVTEKKGTMENHTFSVDKDSPRYRINHEPCTFYDDYEPGHLFGNPFGMWRLSRI